MKKIRFLSNVTAEVRAIPQPIALDILESCHIAISKQAWKGQAKFWSSGKVCCACVSEIIAFCSTRAQDTITVHRIRNCKDAYQ